MKTQSNVLSKRPDEGFRAGPLSTELFEEEQKDRKSTRLNSSHI